jgi:ribosomal-protein-alanine N-acetyltransferase
MKTTIIIRLVKLSDINQMMQVNIKNLAENYTKDFWVTILTKNKNSFVATWTKQVVGYILCDGKSVISFAIDKEYRFRGIGKQLMYHCLNTINNSITLHVRTSNVTASKLYESVGFVVNNVIQNYYQDPVEDANEMARHYQDKRYETKSKLSLVL